MTHQIPYGGTEKAAILARYEAAEDTQDPGADVSLTAPDGEETVSADAGEMGSGEAEAAQPEVDAASLQEEVNQTESDENEEGEAVQEQPSVAPQKPAETVIPSPQVGEHQKDGGSLPGEEPLPEKGGFSEEETAAGQEGRILFSQTQMAMPPAASSGADTLLPFALGVLVTLGITALLLWMRHRCPGGLPRRRPGGRRLRTASVHELGARNEQQDAFCITGLETPGRGVLAAVADGMGGLVDSGQVSRSLIDSLGGSFAPRDETPPARQLQLLFRQALERVENLRKGQTAQSGSTLVMGLIEGDGLSWLSVGDSRIYLWRSGGLIQLNRDHDFSHDLTLLALQGDMSLQETDQDPRRENLTSFIGRGFPRKVEWNPEPVSLCSGDKVVLMSDGVYRALSQEEMAGCLQGDVSRAARALRAMVTKKALPQQDNFTAVILEII